MTKLSVLKLGFMPLFFSLAPWIIGWLDPGVEFEMAKSMVRILVTVVCVLAAVLLLIMYSLTMKSIAEYKKTGIMTNDEGKKYDAKGVIDDSWYLLSALLAAVSGLAISLFAN